MIVQAVTSPGGITAWLVEDYAVPMFALRYAFEGGSSQDPADKAGVANFVALALQHGGGDPSSLTFLRRIEELALRVGFSANRDVAVGSIETLTENRDAAARLLNSIFAHPCFDADAVEDARRRLLGFHAGEARTPAFVAGAQWAATAFAGHPYARPVAGAAATVHDITAQDLEAYCAGNFARDRLKVVAVGDITADELAKFVDEAFGDLPATAGLTPLPAISPALGGRLRVVDMEVSQSAIAFGMGTVPQYDDPGFVAAEMLTHIVGGRGGISKLTEEMRNKRGLAFVARTRLARYGRAPVFRGFVATRNDMVGQSLDIIRDELQKMSDGKFTQADLENAKGYLIGSYPLTFDAHAKIAAELLGRFITGYGPDFLESRKSMIAAMTLDDLKGVAARMLDPENLIVSIAGSPALQPARTV